MAAFDRSRLSQAIRRAALSKGGPTQGALPIQSWPQRVTGVLTGSPLPRFLGDTWESLQRCTL